VSLDDRDLKLERLKWASQREQLDRQRRDAMAAHDRAETQIIRTRIRQAEAQLSLIEEQLNRTRVTAPFDGVVVSGDLSQSLGAPVERGAVLFELAPLDVYRVVLQVDEGDIAAIRIGQKGSLALSALPEDVFALRVERITPVSTAREGRNYFRVEAGLESTSTRLRPGMEGIGKVDVGERRLIWIWTHKLTEWVRLWLWYWWP
jgi:multidrug resistance efflux pump